MRLTLILDGDIGTPLAEQSIPDHDPGALNEALDQITKQAITTLVEEPAAAAAAAEREAKAAEKAAKESNA